MEADNEEDAIAEIEDGVWQFDFVGKPVLFTGKLSQDDNMVPDGDLFIPFNVICELT
ncbi:MAG: hypothetical protein GF317_23320 [Candidatus Lokiarchaeota archaeon]|nr:hypothetical protein [Candidatus Lokiarchaeota archaeon]